MKVINKKAHFDYQILEVVEAGVILSGPEAKSARLGQVDLNNAHVRVAAGVAEVINMHIYPYKFNSQEDYDPDRTRKLLLNKKEILAIENKIKQKGLTVVPTAMYTKGPKVKLEIGLARGKKQYEKREAIKKADLDREIERELRPKDR
jgi:SsrA-binding protein